MTRSMMAWALVASLALSGVALGDGDGHHGRQEDRSADGHAATLGRPGNLNDVTRSIEVEMSDAMRFRPDRIQVQRGETIRFIVRNIGNLKHEMVLGTMEELGEHAALMRKSHGMEHAEPNGVSVPSGKTDELIWQFTRAGTVRFACLEPGHFEAGMIGKILVGRQAE